MRKLFFATLLLAGTGTGATAQNTRVQLQLGNFTASGMSYDRVLSTSLINNIGGSIQRKVCSHVAIKLNYQRWAAPLEGTSGFRPYNSQILGYNIFYPSGDVIKAGQLSHRSNYNIVELVPVYTQKLGKHHEVYGSAGLSFAWGIDAYYQEANWIVGFDLFAPGPVYVPSEQQAAHLGGVAELGYNYKMGRVNTGMSVAGRYYGSNFSTFNLQLNIGYSFNSFK